MPENKDRDVPRSSEYIYGPVFEGNFNGKPNVHIFWGPGQLTTDYPNYTGPNKDAWRHYEHLQIPKVTRFIYATKNDYDTSEYNDDPDGGGGRIELWTVVGVTYGRLHSKPGGPIATRSEIQQDAGALVVIVTDTAIILVGTVYQVDTSVGQTIYTYFPPSVTYPESDFYSL